MTTTYSPPFFARDILFPRGDTAAALSYQLNSNGVTGDIVRRIPRLSDASQAELQRQVADAVARILNLDVADLVFRTLQTYDALVAAARRTALNSENVEIVQLLAIPIPWSAQAIVQVLVDETPVAQIQVELKIVLDLTAEVVVKNGILKAIRSGDCKATVTFLANTVVLTSNTATFNLAIALPLGTGIPLIQLPPPQSGYR